MHFFRSGVIALCLVSGVAMAEPAHETSINELMEVTNTRHLLDNMNSQYDDIINMMIQEALEGHQPTPAQQAVIERMKKRMAGVMQDTMSWDKIQPLYVKIYQDSFSEEEVRGMIDFYKSVAGKAVVEKMPVVMQRSMDVMKPLMQDMFPKMKQIGDDFTEEMAKATPPESAKPADASAPAGAAAKP